MEENFKSINCNDDDVLEIGDYTYKISRFIQALNQAVNSDLAYKLQQELNENGVIIEYRHSERWFTEGLDCKILNLGSPSWKKGKLKFNINVEFYIEEELETSNKPESPLDDLRRLIKEDKDTF